MISKKIFREKFREKKFWKKNSGNKFRKKANITIFF